LLRSTGGSSRRANSAAVHASDPGLSTSESIATAEAFYRERSQPTRFQLGPMGPAGLDEALAARGYAIESPVWVQTASLASVFGRTRVDDAQVALRMRPRPPLRTNIAASPDDSWVDIEITRGRYSDIAPAFLGLLGRLGPSAGFATAHLGTVPAAACLFVHDGDALVIAAMRTLPEARRAGAARALVGAGARWGSERGATMALLLVERDNDPALRLYAGAGFVTAYGYHYRREVP
jgi:ribosomal protein S18 acetylase RimI-like enzyme